MTQNPAAVKGEPSREKPLTVAAAAAFAELIIKESDNNVKLIVLDRFDVLRSKHEHVLDSMVMDILKVLTSPDMEVKRRAISIALEMVSSRNVEDVVLFLKKQLQGTMDEAFDKVSSFPCPGLHQNLEYRQLLIQSIHSCAIKFSEVAANVVYVLMDFLGDSNNPSAVDVIAFVREVVEKFPELRSTITEKLISTFGEIKSGKVFRGALWIVGEYCTSAADIKRALFEIRKVLGEIPILASEQVSVRATRLIASACWMKPKPRTSTPPRSKWNNPKPSRLLECSQMAPMRLRLSFHPLPMQHDWKRCEQRANRLCELSSLAVTFSPVPFSLPR